MLLLHCLPPLQCLCQGGSSAVPRSAFPATPMSSSREPSSCSSPPYYSSPESMKRKGLDPLETVGPPIHPQFQTSHLLHRQPTVPYHLPVSQTIKFTSVQHLSDSQIHQPCSTNPSTNSFLHTINSRHSAKLVDNACILTDCLGLASTSRLL